MFVHTFLSSESSLNKSEKRTTDINFTPPPTSRLYPLAPQAKHPKIVELIQGRRGRRAGYAFEEREKSWCVWNQLCIWKKSRCWHSYLSIRLLIYEIRALIGKGSGSSRSFLVYIGLFCLHHIIFQAFNCTLFWCIWPVYINCTRYTLLISALILSGRVLTRNWEHFSQLLHIDNVNVRWFLSWCVILLGVAMTRWFTVIINRWTWFK